MTAVTPTPPPTTFDVPARLARYRSSARYRGTSRGLSMPVAGGLRYRVGSARGAVTAQRALVVEDEGRLIQTPAGLLFVGRQRTVTVPRAVYALAPRRDGVAVYRIDRESVDVYLLDRASRALVAGLPIRSRGWPLAPPEDPALTAIIWAGLVLFLGFPSVYSAVGVIPLWLCWLVILVGVVMAGWGGKIYPRRWVRIATWPLRAGLWIAVVSATVLAAMFIGHARSSMRSSRVRR